MVQRIGDDGILIGKKRLEQASVGIETAAYKGSYTSVLKKR
jgi:hypothetical protein